MSRRALAAIAVVSVVGGAPAPARAATSPEASASASEAYRLGVEHFRAKRYSDAIAEFNKAYRVDPNPVLVFNMARAFEELREYAAAIEFYRKYLVMAADAEDRPQVEATLRTLELLQARAQSEVRVPLGLASQPTGATVVADGREAGVTPLQLELTPGEHFLTFDKAGHERATLTVQLEVGKPARHEVTLLASPAVPPPVADRDDTWAWVALGTGAALLGGGAFFGWRALDEHDAADGYAADGDADRLATAQDDGGRYALYADGLYATGATAVITGLVLLLTGPDDARATSGAHRAAP